MPSHQGKGPPDEAVRDAVVRSRTRWLRVVRTLLRHHGYRLQSGAVESFLGRVEEPELSADLQATLEPLLRTMQSVNEPLAALEQQTGTMAHSEEVVERLSTAPGIGPLTALAFVATLDEVARCNYTPQFESSLGLVPREGSLDEQQWRGTLTKQGSGRVQAL